MAWDMQWYDEAQSILLFTVKPDSTWTDFDLAMNKFALELGASSKPIHAIIYNEYGFSRENPLPHIRAQMYKLAMFKNRGILVTVTPKHSTSVLLTMVELVFRLLRLEMKQGVFVRTMDEAIARINAAQMSHVVPANTQSG